MRKPINFILFVVLCLIGFSSQAAEKSGVLQWSKRVDLSSPVSGVISKVFVSVGDKVTKGQRLIKIDDRAFQSRIKQARAVLVRTKETYDEAKRELVRAQELFDRDSISVRDQQLVKIDYTKANASVQEADAVLTKVLLDMEYSTIRSPVNGIIVQKSVAVGETVNNAFQATTMIVVANHHEMIARVLLGLDEIQGLKSGASLDVNVQGKMIRGRVKSLGQESVSGDKKPLYQMDVLFKNPGGLRQGQKVTILLP